MQVLVNANGFRGDFEAWLQLSDLVQFANEVEAMYESVRELASATLASAEPGINIRLDMQHSVAFLALMRSRANDQMARRRLRGDELRTPE